VLNPLFAEDDSARDVNSIIYQGLTTVDSHQNVVGQLARDWTISPDLLTYTFNLRDDVKWADGQQFGLDDVLFTFHVLQDPEYGEPGAEFWRQVGVAQGAAPGQVVFSLRSPSSAFPLALRIGIIAKHLFGGLAPPQMAASPFSGVRAMGTGPFRVAAIDQRAITLDRNPYAKPAPFLDHFEFRTYAATGSSDAIKAVLQGVADLVGGIAPQDANVLRDRADVDVASQQTFTSTFVAFNADGDGKQFFSDPKVRQAIVQGVDRKRIIQDVLEGRADPAVGPIPPGAWAYSSPVAPATDQVAAAKALDAAGWQLVAGSQPSVRAKDSVQFKVTLVVADAYPYREVADSVASQLGAIGVVVDVKPVSPSELVAKYLTGRHYELALAAFDVGSDPDQYALWHSGADVGTINFSYQKGWGLIDKDLEDGRAAVTTTDRMKAYADFQTLIVKAEPAIFLYSPRYDYVISKRVHGVRLDSAIEPEDRFSYVDQWYVMTKAATH
jgi:peptide/nickel transport system substrate-binding protein